MGIAICTEEMQNELFIDPGSSNDVLLACWFGGGLGIFCLFLKFFSLKLYKISLLAKVFLVFGKGNALLSM